MPENEGKQGYEEAIDTLKAELNRLRQEVAALKHTGTARSTEQMPTVATIIAGDNLTTDRGFYPVERTDDGVAFCWTGPSNKFALDLSVDRFAGAVLRLDAISFLDFDRQKNLQLHVDGQPAPVSVVKGGMGVIVGAELPPRMGNEPTHLEFTLPVTLPPPNTADTRSLGLAFFKLTVRSSA